MDCRSSVRVVFQLDELTRKEVWFGRGSGEGEEEGWSLDRPRVVEVLKSLTVLAAIARLARSTLYAGECHENEFWHLIKALLLINIIS